MSQSTDTGSNSSKSNVLLLVPGFSPDEDTICGKLLDVASGARTRAVLVACARSPESLLSVWDEHVDTNTVERAVVNVDMLTRSASADADASAVATGPGDDIRLVTIDDPDDLVDIGAAIERALDDPAADDTVLCFHSLTDLIQHRDTRSMFTFLESLTGTVERAGATAHYHMDPTVHDPETIRTIEGLFDVTFDVREH